jgi:predicted dehydrogenase
MKIIIAGLGSMGKRRLRLLQKNFENLELYGVDKIDSRRKFAEDNFAIKTFADFREAFNMVAPDAVFVCTSPLEHKDIVIYSLQNQAHTFSEINLHKDGYQEIIALSREHNKVAFLSSTMLYRKECQWLNDRVIPEKKCSYRYHIGQYLPDWHPWENYTDFFVGDKRTNACREILAIELPWLIKTFGKIEKFFLVKDKLSELKIDYPDTFHLIFAHKNGNIGNLSVDVVSRKGGKKFELYSENIHIFWEGTPESLSEYNIAEKKINQVRLYENLHREKNYNEAIIENAYEEEINTFFALTEKKLKTAVYSYDNDIYTLDIVDDIEAF